MRPISVYLIRHARTAWNSGRRAQGHSNIELDAEGCSQAIALASRFAEHSVAKVYSSDLARCCQTAAPVAEICGAELVTTPILRERSFGEWEGMLYDEVRAHIRAIGGLAEEARPPGGESIADVWCRLNGFVQLMQEWTEDTAVVTHGGAKALLLAQLTQGTLTSGRSYSFENTSVTELERRPDGYYSLIRYADTSHLHSKGPKTAFGIIG